MMTTAAAPGQPDRRSPTAARILVVDDEPSLARLLTIDLSYEGWKARSAGDDFEAGRG